MHHLQEPIQITLTSTRGYKAKDFLLFSLV